MKGRHGSETQANCLTYQHNRGGGGGGGGGGEHTHTHARARAHTHTHSDYLCGKSLLHHRRRRHRHHVLLSAGLATVSVVTPSTGRNSLCGSVIYNYVASVDHV